MSKRSRHTSLVEVTNRISGERPNLESQNELDQIILGIMGRAQRTYPVLVHGFAFAADHYHLLLTPGSAQRLARFVGFVERNIAREVSRFSGCGPDFWARKYKAVQVGQEESAQVARLRHILVHRHRGDLAAVSA